MQLQVATKTILGGDDIILEKLMDQKKASHILKSSLLQPQNLCKDKNQSKRNGYGKKQGAGGSKGKGKKNSRNSPNKQEAKKTLADTGDRKESDNNNTSHAYIFGIDLDA